MTRIKTEENKPDDTPTVNELTIKVTELTHELNAKTLELEGTKQVLRHELKEKAELKYKNQLLEAQVLDLTEQLKASDRRSLYGYGSDSDRQRNNWANGDRQCNNWNNDDRQRNNWNNGDRKRSHSQARNSYVSRQRNASQTRYFPPQRSRAPPVNRQRNASQTRYFPQNRSRAPLVNSRHNDHESGRSSAPPVNRQRNASQTRYFPQSRSRASSVNRQRNISQTRHNSGNANLVHLADRRQSYDQMQFAQNQPFANQGYPYNLAHFQPNMDMNSNQPLTDQNYPYNLAHAQSNVNTNSDQQLPYQSTYAGLENEQNQGNEDIQVIEQVQNQGSEDIQVIEQVQNQGSEDIQVIGQMQSNVSNQKRLGSFFPPMQPRSNANQQGRPATHLSRVFAPGQPISSKGATNRKRSSSAHQPRRT